MTPPLLPHAPRFGFPARDGQLLVGGMPLAELVAQAGGTPLYVYDSALIARRVAEVRAWLPSAVRLHYALKANPLPALADFLGRHVDGFDVASAGELHIALGAGMAAARVGFAGPGKREAEIIEAAAAGVLINVESARDLTILSTQAARGVPGRYAVRVNPDFELRGSGMRMGGGARPFGVDAEQVPSLLASVSRSGPRFEGFHVYAGSQCLDGEALATALRQSYRLAGHLSAHAPCLPKSFNLGGGFGIPYFPGEKPIDTAPVAKALAEIAADAERTHPGLELILELGRYLVGEAGVYVTRVVDRKVSRGRMFLVTDGGLNHHLAASGNFGQVLRKNYPLAIGNRMGDRTGDEPVTIVGPLCTPLDLIGDNVKLPQAAEGDLVVVFQSGAYGASASPQAFLGHPPVKEILV